MTVRLGDIAPDFTAATTQGEIKFHAWLGDSWGMLFSHPKDFTPVCTTKLGYIASVKSHEKWESDIGETQGTPTNWKDGQGIIIGDAVTDKEAKTLFPDDWKTIKPYLRTLAQPKSQELVRK